MGEHIALDVPDQVGHEIYDILTHPEDALYSFSPVPETLDPLDLQASHAARLRAQREELLCCLRLQANAEVLEQPERFFQTIVTEFTTVYQARVAWQGRRVWDYDDAFARQEHVIDTAHAVTYQQRPGGLQPNMWISVGYADRQPCRYAATTKLHHSEDWEYVFESNPRGFLVSRKGYRNGMEYTVPVEDAAEQATLLQALGVEMLDAITTIKQPSKKMRAVNHEIARRRTYQLLQER